MMRANSTIRKSRFRLLTVALAVVLTAGAVSRQGPDAWQPALRQMTTASEPWRLVEARLAEDLPYRTHLASRAGLESDAVGRLSRAASQVKRRVRLNPTAETISGLGLAFMLTGEAADAVRYLEEGSRIAPHRPELKIQLTAAYLERARELHQPYDYVLALATAEEALRRLPESTAAHFNRALALEKLFLVEEARRAWKGYLDLDPSSEWAEEARSRLEALERRFETEIWSRHEPYVDDADSNELTRLTRRFPMWLRIYAERRLFPAWSVAIEAGQDETATLTLRRARAIADTFADELDDDMLRDAVRAIDDARPDCVEALAAAHESYLLGRQAYDELDTERVQAALSSARRDFARCGSPFAFSAEIFQAASRYHGLERQQALEDMERLARRPEMGRFPNLRATAHWIIGVLYSIRGEAEVSIRHHRRALDDFRRVREIENVAAVEGLLAYTYDYLGETANAWAHRYEALRYLPLIEHPKRIHLIATGAAVSAQRLGHLHVALIFRHRAVDAAHRWQGSAVMSEVYYRRGQVYAMVGRRELARQDFETAARAAIEVSDEKQRRQAEADIRMMEGELLVESEPQRAIRLLGEALETNRLYGLEEFLPSIYRHRAAAYRAIGRADLAAADLERGIELFEARRDKVEDPQLKTFYFDQSNALFDAMIRLQVEEGEPSAAFHSVERSRARVLLDLSAGAGTHPQNSPRAAAPLSLDEVRDAMPAEVTLIQYAMLDDRLLRWAIEQDRETFNEYRIDAEALRNDIEAFSYGLRGDIEPAELSALSSRLYELLLGSLELPPGHAVVIVPDKALHTVPFAALKNRDGRFLVEERTLGVAPSATLFIASARRHQEIGDAAATSVLAIGNPSFDRDRFPRLESLGSAEIEARQIAHLYRHGDVLVGEAATPASFVELASEYEVVHVAAHALVDRSLPEWSKLVLAGDVLEGSPGTLPAWQIADLDLERTRLVTLGACSTASGYLWVQEGVSSLARSFLAAGVPAVVAPLWDVDDGATSVFMVELHRRLAQGIRPRAALRSAQLHLLRSEDQELRRPAHWAGFQLIGGIVE